MQGNRQYLRNPVLLFQKIQDDLLLYQKVIQQRLSYIFTLLSSNSGAIFIPSLTVKLTRQLLHGLLFMVLLLPKPDCALRMLTSVLSTVRRIILNKIFHSIFLQLIYFRMWYYSYLTTLNKITYICENKLVDFYDYLYKQLQKSIVDLGNTGLVLSKTNIL